MPLQRVDGSGVNTLNNQLRRAWLPSLDGFLRWHRSFSFMGSGRCRCASAFSLGFLPRNSMQDELDPPAPPVATRYHGSLSDHAIAERIILGIAYPSDPLRMEIRPYFGSQCKTLATDTPRQGLAHTDRCVSYGLTCKGYDVRLGNHIRRREKNSYQVADLFPVAPHQRSGWQEPERYGWGCPILLEPGECVLAETIETVYVPRDCIVLVMCKSTWAREFLNLNTTPLEPGWKGTVTLELKNMNPIPLVVYPGHGIAQLVFVAGPIPTVAYDQRANPTYQNQTGPTPAKV